MLDSPLSPSAKPDLPENRWTARTVRFVRQARMGSSNDTTKIGAVIWNAAPDGRYNGLSIGSNKFPAGVFSSKERNDRYFGDLSQHAEGEAIAGAAGMGRSLLHANLTGSACPCRECMGGAIESGIARITIDGSQKYRPTFFRNWFPEKGVSLDMAERAGLEVDIHELSLDAPVEKGGRPDLVMTEAELARSPVNCLSASPFKAGDPAEGYRLFRQLAEEKKSISHEKADPWLARPHHATAPTHHGDRPVTLAMQAADKAIRQRDRTGSPFPDHAALLIDRQTGESSHVELSRPPLGSDDPAMSQQEALAFSMQPEQLLVAHAARDGFPLKGAQVFVTHHPTQRGAVYLAGAGVERLIVDDRNLPQALGRKEADNLWKAHVILHESGIETIFSSAESAAAFLRTVRDHASPDLLANLTPHEPRRHRPFAAKSSRPGSPPQR